MDGTLLIGLGIVALGAAVGAIMMFGQRANSLAETAGNTGGNTGTLPAPPAGPPHDLSRRSAAAETPEALRPPVPRGLRSTDVRIRWYQRVRAALGLILITLGIGMAIGAAVGAAALVVSVLLG